MTRRPQSEPRRRIGRGRWWRVAVLLLAVLSAGCGVLELGGGAHQAVVVEQAESFESESWTVLTELLSTEISGATVIALRFDASQLSCADGQEADPERLELGTEFTFEQSGDVELTEPPQVTGVDLEVDCD